MIMRLLYIAAIIGTASAARAQEQQPSSTPTVRVASDTTDDTDQDATVLAKQLQNPFGKLYYFQFQNNTNLNNGPHKGTQNVLNFQPIIPIQVNENWNIITRTILPLIWEPSQRPAHTVPFGTGPTTFSAFLSPSRANNGWLWGIGPIVQLPTISNATLGSNVWGAGPTGAVVYLQGPWVAGVLVNDVWSLGGTTGHGGTHYNNFLTQIFVNYNFSGGWYVGSEPIITARWPATANKAWTLPVGAEVGRVMIVKGKLPINLQFGAYYNTIRPESGSAWQLRTEVTFIF